MIYLYLFVSFLQVGMFSFGGGYAAMPLIQEQVVTIHHWLDISEFTDLVTISQLQGILNALRPAVIAMIASAGISILITAFWGNAAIKLINTNWSLMIIFVICFALLQKLKMNPIGVMVLAGIMKLGLSLIKK